jgi:hypothetical protein
MVVVEARSYSRNSGSTSQLSVTVSPAASHFAAIIRSCDGLMKLNNRHTATCRRPPDWMAAMSRSTSSSVSGSTTSPRASIRSRTVNQFSSGVIGFGRSTRSAYSCGRFCRPMRSMSRKPSVVTNATGSPRRWSKALVATVEPWTMEIFPKPEPGAPSAVALDCHCPARSQARATASITAL